jgi:ABC-type transport system substrate-binding protein
VIRWAGLFALLAITPAAHAEESTLRAVMNIELPMGYMVYDTLIAMDQEGKFHPQMLQKWDVSDDRLTWTFMLRPGLAWHDGSPVTADDCIGFEMEPDPAKRQDLADEMQARVLAQAPQMFLGQFSPPTAHRSNLRGVIANGLHVFWSVQRE